MKIATWNVNSVRARLDSLETWIENEAPEVILLQEIKCQKEAFPYDFFESKGYACAVLGQKSYNGVAILSQLSLEDVQYGLPTFQEDPAARYIEAVVGGKLRVASVYVPNGGAIVGEGPYLYKLDFLERMQDHLRTLAQYHEMVWIGGDYNIAPSDADVYDAKIWHERVCCTTKERHAFQELLAANFQDALKEYCDVHTTEPLKHYPFTWWDYRRKISVTQNLGLRLDHFLVSPLAQAVTGNVAVHIDCRILPRPSDHAPLVCSVDL